MRRFTLGFLVILLAIAVPAAVAQSGGKAQVCVAGLENNGTQAAPGGVRDALIKFMDKLKNGQEQGVPLETISPADSLAAAKEKNCEYVVTTKVIEEHSDSGYAGGLSQVNMQTFYITVEYKLVKVSDGSVVSTGSVKASDRGTAQNAVVATMKKIAEKVNDSIKK